MVSSSVHVSRCSNCSWSSERRIHCKKKPSSIHGLHEEDDKLSISFDLNDCHYCKSQSSNRSRLKRLKNPIQRQLVANFNSLLRTVMLFIQNLLAAIRRYDGRWFVKSLVYIVFCRLDVVLTTSVQPPYDRRGDLFTVRPHADTRVPCKLTDDCTMPYHNWTAAAAALSHGVRRHRRVHRRRHLEDDLSRVFRSTATVVDSGKRRKFSHPPSSSSASSTTKNRRPEMVRSDNDDRPEVVLTKVVVDFDRSVGDRLRRRPSIDETDLHSSSSTTSFNWYMSTDVDPSTVAYLSLCACNITDMPTDMLVDTPRLTRLSLWSNNITRLPVGFLDKTRRLRDLVMWNNRLRRLDPNMFVPRATRDREPPPSSPLHLLDVDRNSITSINSDDQIWHRFPELQVLRLSGNQIGSLASGSFNGLSALRVLTLDQNRLAFVQSATFGNDLPRLIRLSMSDNELVFLPDGLFAGLGSLVELSLARNRIENIWSRTFTGLSQLRILDLSGNKLSQVPDDTFGSSITPQLSRLSLDNNRLRTLRRCLFPPGPSSSQRSSTSSVSLLGNPSLQCDCRLSWLARVISTGSLPTVWGSCDVRLPAPPLPTAVNNTAGESTGTASSWFAAMSSTWTDRSSLTAAAAGSNSASFRSPIKAAAVHGLFDVCDNSPADECTRP